MPQDGSNNYYYPPGTPGVPDTTIESEAYNTFLNDLVTNDLNIARPIHRGGTGGINIDQALNNLTAEKAAQVVTNYDTHVWIPGSFLSTPGATGAPDAVHYFSGFCYWQNAGAIFLEARGHTTGEPINVPPTTWPSPRYVREKWATWGPWLNEAAALHTGASAKVNRVGDTMTGILRFAKTVGAAPETLISIDGYFSDYTSIPAIDWTVNNNLALPVTRIGTKINPSGSADLLFYASNNFGVNPGRELMRIEGGTEQVLLGPAAYPTANQHVVTKLYADSKLSLAGGVMTGLINGAPSTGNIGALAGGNMQVWGAGSTNAAAMTFHMPGVFICALGLDSDAQFKIGGGTFGSGVAHKIAHEGVGELIPHGQCRLVAATTTSLNLAPYNGNAIRIAGVNYRLPAAGLTITNSGLAANTTYYVYVYHAGGGALSLEFSSTGHVKDVSTAGNFGVEIKSDSVLRTFVGLARTNASAQFYDDVTNGRGVASWFNRQKKAIAFPYANGATSSTAMATFATSGPCCVFAGDIIEGSYTSMGSNSAAASFGAISLTVVGAGLSAPLNYAYCFQPPATPQTASSMGSITANTDDSVLTFQMAALSSSAGNAFYVQNNQVFGTVMG